MFLIIKALAHFTGSQHYLSSVPQPATPEELEIRGRTIIKSLRTYEDWPKKGVAFKDISPTVKDPDLLNEITDLFVEQLKSIGDFKYLVCLESRGFLYGTALALRLKKGIVMARKPGKLPGETVRYSYQKEYGADVFEIQKDSIEPGDKVVIVDDILATGGTIEAAVQLVKQVGAVATAAVVVYEVAALNGRKKISPGVRVISLASE